MAKRDDESSARRERARQRRSDDDAPTPADDDLDDEDDLDEEAGEGEDAPDHLDPSAARVAQALGLDETAEAEEEETKGPRNRAERRRERAQRRRRGRRGPPDAAAAATAAADADDEEEDDDAPLAKDRNLRLREELLRKRRKAARREQVKGLAPSEMVDDAFARGGAATWKWLRRHRSAVIWGAILLVAAGVGYVVYQHRADTTTAAASDDLLRGALAEQSAILPEDEDTRTDEEKRIDPRRVFPSVEARDEAALKAYRKVVLGHAGTGAAILGKLGEAGIYLDKKEYDKAAAAFGEVLGTELAAADPDVRARALEGMAYAKEGKEDIDGAMAEFTKLKAIAGYKALALYHRARLLLSKGEKEEAKKAIAEARTALSETKVEEAAAGALSSHAWLRQALEDMLRQIDPNALPPPASPGFQMPDNVSPEVQEQLRRMFEGQGQPFPGPPGGPR